MTITPENFTQFLAWLHRQEKVAYDIETNALDYRAPGSRIIGIGVSNFSNGFYLPLYNYDPATEQLVDTPVAAFAVPMRTALQSKKIITFNLLTTR